MSIIANIHVENYFVAFGVVGGAVALFIFWLMSRTVPREDRFNPLSLLADWFAQHLSFRLPMYVGPYPQHIKYPVSAPAAAPPGLPHMVTSVLRHKFTDDELLDLADQIPESGLIMRTLDRCGSCVTTHVFTPDKPISTAELEELSEPGKILYVHLVVQDACIDQMTQPEAVAWLQRMTLIDHPQQPMWVRYPDNGFDPHPACADHW